MHGMGSSENQIPANMETNKIVSESDDKSKKERMMFGFYILGVSGVTAAVAGLVTSHIAKKKSREYLKELGKEPKVVMESPHSLALRALAWGTFWAVGVFSVSIFGLWKWYGIKDMEDLRTRIRKYTKKSNQPEGRTEFESFSDFLNYLNETSSKKTSNSKNT